MFKAFSKPPISVLWPTKLPLWKLIVFTDWATLIMKNFSDPELAEYLSKISDENLYAYNVYQIEGEGRNLFSSIEGDEDTIMGLPIKKIKEFLNLQKWRNIL